MRVVVSFETSLLCALMMLARFGMQLQMTLTVFLLNILLSLEFFGKCLSINFRNFWPTFVDTFLLNGGLNHMMLCCRLRLLFFGCLSL